MMPPGSSIAPRSSIGIGTLRLSPPQILSATSPIDERDADGEQHLREMVARRCGG